MVSCELCTRLLQVRLAEIEQFNGSLQQCDTHLMHAVRMIFYSLCISFMSVQVSLDLHWLQSHRPAGDCCACLETFF